MNYDEFFDEAHRLDIRLSLTEEKPLEGNRFIGGPWAGQERPPQGNEVPLAIAVPEEESNGLCGVYKLSVKLSVVHGDADHPVYKWHSRFFPLNLPKKEDLDL